MSLKLLSILREEISEQGIYRKTMVTPSSGKRSKEEVGALRFDDKGEFLGFIKPEDVGKKPDKDFIGTDKPIPVDPSKYDSIKFLKSHLGDPLIDKINPYLLYDINMAAKLAGTTPTVTTAVTGHEPGSRHERGLAVDLAIFNGLGYSDKNDAKAKGIYDDIVNFVNELKNMGYKLNGSEVGGDEKNVYWFGFPNHDHHVHVSRITYGEKEKINNKEEIENINPDEIITIEKPSYIININNPSRKKIALIWGGTPSSSYGAKYMEREVKSFLKNKNVIYSDWENTLSQINQILTNNDLEEYKINSILGFSKGGEETWDYINSGYEFIGLIDPSTPNKISDIPSNVKIMSNSGNWKKNYSKTLYPNIKKLEDSGYSERVGTDSNFNHFEFPKLFFKKYSSEI